MNVSLLYQDGVASAGDLAAAVERRIADGDLRPGERLPTVRDLAARLRLSPTTVAAAYRTLSGRGLVTGEGRRGTRVRLGPALAMPAEPEVPAGTIDLASGNPDSHLLPPLRPLLRGLDLGVVNYGAPATMPELARLGVAAFVRDGIPAARVTAVGGAMDGVERVLVAHLRPGDRVAVEDPGFPRVFDLVAALGLLAIPVTIDERGMTPASLEAGLASGARAVVLTPRAQNPTGACLDAARAADLRTVLDRHPNALVVEDDHAGPVAGAPVHTLADAARPSWAVVRSVAKSIGPDIRVALLTGDGVTLDRVEGRQRLGTGWVSHLLQEVVVAAWSDPGNEARFAHAAATYTRRRDALRAALAGVGITVTGRSGMNVWVPVQEEQPVARALLAAGWAVATGERFRVRTPPALRVTTAGLGEAQAPAFAAALAAAVAPSTRRTPSA